MCDNVIIHKWDGTEIVCENQGELNAQMPNGLAFPPPSDYALWSVNGHGFYIARGALEPPLWVPADDPPDDTTLIDEWGYEPEICLCPVDLETTARINGYRYSKDDPNGEFDPFDTHFYEVSH